MDYSLEQIAVPAACGQPCWYDSNGALPQAQAYFMVLETSSVQSRVWL